MRCCAAQGRYVADVTPAGALHAVVLRSPHAHARFTHRRSRRACAAMPGVRLMLTGGRHRRISARCRCRRHARRADIEVPPYPVLARDVVRHVGDAVAFVVADTLEQAKDAAEAIAIDWQPLPHVIGAERRAEARRAAGLAGPARQSRLRDRASATRPRPRRPSPRPRARSSTRPSSTSGWSPIIIDTRGVVAEYDGERYTLTLGSQGSHIIRDIIGGEVLKLPPEKMRVITPDVGGGFGTKLFPYREYALAAVAASSSRKPVKWVADRTEHFLGDSHGRDNVTTARAGARRQGQVPRARRRHRRRHGRLSVGATRPTSPGSAPAWRPASTTSRPRMCGCAASTPTPCRSTPIAAPGGRRPPI